MAIQNQGNVQSIRDINFEQWFLTLASSTMQYYLRSSGAEIDTENYEILLDNSNDSMDRNILLDFTKVTYNGWFSSANDMFDFYISNVNPQRQQTALSDYSRMRATYPLSKTLGVCAAITEYSRNYAYRKFIDFTSESVGCIVTTISTLLQDGYNQLFYGDTQNSDLREVLIQPAIQVPGLGPGRTRRLGDDKEKINLTDFNAFNISKENINDILVIFDDDKLKNAIQNVNDDDYRALNDYDTDVINSIENIKVILFILLTSYDVKGFIYSHHNKGEGNFYIFKILFESEILNSVLITYS